MDAENWGAFPMLFIEEADVGQLDLRHNFLQSIIAEIAGMIAV
jgi:hypothetical protein